MFVVNEVFGHRIGNWYSNKDDYQVIITSLGNLYQSRSSIFKVIMMDDDTVIGLGRNYDMFNIKTYPFWMCELLKDLIIYDRNFYQCESIPFDNDVEVPIYHEVSNNICNEAVVLEALKRSHEIFLKKEIFKIRIGMPDARNGSVENYLEVMVRILDFDNFKIKLLKNIMLYGGIENS